MKKYYILVAIVLAALTLFGCASSAFSTPAQVEQEDPLDAIIERLSEQTNSARLVANSLEKQSPSGIVDMEQLKTMVLDTYGFDVLLWKQLSADLILDTYKFDPAIMWPNGSTNREMKWGRSYILQDGDVLYIIAYQQYRTKIGMYRVYHFYTRDGNGTVTNFDTLDKQIPLADLVYGIRRYFYSTGEYKVP